MGCLSGIKCVISKKHKNIKRIGRYTEVPVIRKGRSAVAIGLTEFMLGLMLIIASVLEIAGRFDGTIYTFCLVFIVYSIALGIFKPEEGD
jgi:uncharacterized membrane protein YjfL (UPF0719 family)